MVEMMECQSPHHLNHVEHVEDSPHDHVINKLGMQEQVSPFGPSNAPSKVPGDQFEGGGLDDTCKQTTGSQTWEEQALGYEHTVLLPWQGPPPVLQRRTVLHPHSQCPSPLHLVEECVQWHGCHHHHSQHQGPSFQHHPAVLENSLPSRIGIKISEWNVKWQTLDYCMTFCSNCYYPFFLMF